MSRDTPFSPGKRWRCKHNEKHPWSRFDFVIVGPGSKSDRKMCRLEYLPGVLPLPPCSSHDPQAQHEYTHKHLRKYAVLLGPEAILLQQEPETETREFQDLERCCFCRTPTPFWVLNAKGQVDGESVACCYACAETHGATELPTKRAWCEKEAGLRTIFSSGTLVVPKGFNK